MANTSLNNFLNQRCLTHKEPALSVARARQRLEKSEFLKSMQETCASINTHAGTVVVDEHHYLPPEPVVSSFAFSKGHTEYLMRLELWGRKPSLVFLTRKWRDASPNRFLRWIYRVAEVEPLSIDFKYSCELESDNASLEEIEQCFYFLLSGLDRRYIPSFRFSKDSARSMSMP
jgi:hypothetical protein